MSADNDKKAYARGFYAAAVADRACDLAVAGLPTGVAIEKAVKHVHPRHAAVRLPAGFRVVLERHVHGFVYPSIDAMMAKVGEDSP